MPSSIVGPGTRLAGRYRLEDHVVDAGGTSYWRGEDELLVRDVGVRTAPADHDTAQRLSAAARAAAATPDVRFLQVLDVAEDQGQVYVVSEWAAGRTLEELLASGPLPTRLAVGIVAEVADALAGAHDRHLWHGCLRPANIVVDEACGVTIVGLEVDAVIAGLPPWDRTDPTAAAAADARDAHGCGALLYAALTGRWPLTSQPAHLSSLLPAPLVDGSPPTPRQVRAGVPTALDVLVARAMGQQGGRAMPLTSTRRVAAALHGVWMPDSWGDEPEEQATLDASDPRRLPAVAAPGSGRPIVLLVVLLVAALVALLGWQAATTLTRGHDARASAPAANPQGAVAGGTAGAGAADAGGPDTAGRVVPISAVTDVDPQGDGEENPDTVGYAVDGDLATAWTTRTYYGRADLGGLKEGVGLALDLGAVRRVTSVHLDLVGTGTDLTLARADSRSAVVPGGYTVLASARDVGASVTFRPPAPVPTRYLLVWLTRLPLDASGGYRGGVAEVSVRALPEG